MKRMFRRGTTARRQTRFKTRAHLMQDFIRTSYWTEAFVCIFWTIFLPKRFDRPGLLRYSDQPIALHCAAMKFALKDFPFSVRFATDD
jgi:hypothetical protein